MHDLIERHLGRVEAKKAQASYDTHKTNLRQFDAWLENNEYDLCEIRALELEMFFLEMKNEGYAPNTIASRFESVRGLYNNLAGIYEVLDENPVEDLHRRDLVEKNTKKHDNASISYVSPEEKEALSLLPDRVERALLEHPKTVTFCMIGRSVSAATAA